MHVYYGPLRRHRHLFSLHRGLDRRRARGRRVVGAAARTKLALTSGPLHPGLSKRFVSDDPRQIRGSRGGTRDLMMLLELLPVSAISIRFFVTTDKSFGLRT